MRLTAVLRRYLPQVSTSILDHYSYYNPSPLSIKQFIDFGSKSGSQEMSFNFLRSELPVRMANIMKEINHLPENLLRMPSVVDVMGWYEQSFKELLQFESDTLTDKTLTAFTDALIHIRNRHANVVETMAQGIIELKETHGVNSAIDNRVQYFLDRFYMSRISIRMLINQHTLLFGPQLAHPRHIGCIDPACNVLNIVQDAYENARFLCEQYYLLAPEVEIVSRNPLEKDEAIFMVYVPSHLYHMLFELFKNSMRATVELNPTADEVPKIRVMIAKGSEDLSIKVSDEGGGVPRSKVDLLFQYMYSTAPQPQLSGEGSAPLAGYGYGLPLSRLYARYFQGDLILNSIEGYGTDAIVSLKVLSDEANEHLPVYNKTTSRVYQTDVPVHDWSSPVPHGGGVATRSFNTWARMRA